MSVYYYTVTEEVEKCDEAGIRTIDETTNRNGPLSDVDLLNLREGVKRLIQHRYEMGAAKVAEHAAEAAPAKKTK